MLKLLLCFIIYVKMTEKYCCCLVLGLQFWVILFLGINVNRFYWSLFVIVNFDLSHFILFDIVLSWTVTSKILFGVVWAKKTYYCSCLVVTAFNGAKIWIISYVQVLSPVDRRPVSDLILVSNWSEDGSVEAIFKIGSFFYFVSHSSVWV